MENTPLISFIVPVYNVEKYLPTCLDSLVNQTLKDIEIVCVDDCSTDSSYKLLLEYQQRDNRIKVIKQKQNRRQGAARNVAIKAAIGKYLSFVDSDDWLDSTFAEDMMNAALSTNADLVRGGAIDYYGEDKQIPEPYNHAQYFLQADREQVLKHVCLNGGRMWGRLSENP